MSKTLFISDSQIGSSLRGAEQCDQIIYNSLDVDFMTCAEFNIKRLKTDKYLISNFAQLSITAKDYLSNKNYSIISHDFLILPTRDPTPYENFGVDPAHLINIEFFNNAKVNFCQSSFQASIFLKNGVKNCYSWEGNLWTEQTISELVQLGKNAKNGRGAIIDDPYKNTKESLNWAQHFKISVDLIPKMEYASFLSKLSEYSVYIFNCGLVESFCRILLEAKLMNLVCLTNRLCGATYTELYNYNGAELGVKLNEKREEILKLLTE